MFALCRAMKWAHLPVVGGIYDQHPQLIDDFMVIFQAQSEQQEMEQAKREREMKSKSKTGR